jgi:hypothetical protein
VGLHILLWREFFVPDGYVGAVAQSADRIGRYRALVFGAKFTNSMC